MQEKMTKNISESKTMGLDMADMMIKNGALELLKEAEKVAFKDEMPQRL